MICNKFIKYINPFLFIYNFLLILFSNSTSLAYIVQLLDYDLA